MNPRFPFSLVLRGPGYYLTDAQGQTVAAMNASKQDAEFILLACNSLHSMLEACKAAQSELTAIRQTFIDAIGYDPHEDANSVYQEELEDLDRAVAAVANAVATAPSEP